MQFRHMLCPGAKAYALDATMDQDMEGSVLGCHQIWIMRFALPGSTLRGILPAWRLGRADTQQA
jgi:hypothetical protein